MIVALAGRRIDAPSTSTPAFPLQDVKRVREELAALFESERATALVSSAACGADLVALEVAGRRSMRRRIVLPSSPEAFRESSVIDRPGDWGRLFDECCGAARRSGDLVLLDLQAPADEAYLEATERILSEAISLAGPQGSTGVVAIVVWNGPRKRGFDATRFFRDTARRKRIRVREVSSAKSLEGGQ